jgi:hypothetical protein
MDQTGDRHLLYLFGHKVVVHQGSLQIPQWPPYLPLALRRQELV